MAVAFNGKHLAKFIRPEEYEAIYPQVELAHKQLETKTGFGNDFLGWLDLPVTYDKEEFARIKEAAQKIRSDSDVLLVAGIGGSYLGARAVVEAVKGLYHNETSDGPKIYFCGNTISPTALNDIIKLTKGKRFSINVISKSGTTTETALAFRVLRKLGMFPAEKAKKKYTPKPYEQMTYPGERVQVDVKVVPRKCITDPELRLFQYTAIDEFTRLRFLAAYPEQSTYSSADFLKRLVKWYARRGIQVECVQTDNGFEFTNRFSNSKRDLPTLFENTAAKLGIRHKLIRPYTPRHNGKVERSHREDQKRFYSCHTFYSLEDFAKQLAVHNRRSNNFPMRPLRWLSPAEFTVQYV